MKASAIEQQFERPAYPRSVQLSDIGTHEGDFDAGFPGAFARCAQCALDDVDACRPPAVLRQIDRQRAHAAAEIDGMARGQGLGTLDEIAQGLRWHCGPSVPWRQSQEIGKL